MTDMKQINQRLFECDDCGARRFIRWVELTRAAKPRCMRCGCTRMDLVSEDARKDRARLNSARLDRLADLTRKS